MLPLQAVFNTIQRVSPEQQEIILELRNIIAEAAPQASEVFQWGGLSYYDAARGGTVSAAICQIGIERDHVRLGFVHGAFLPDPKKLLQGERKYKRFVKITSYIDAPWEDLKELVAAAARFDPRALKMR